MTEPTSIAKALVPTVVDPLTIRQLLKGASTIEQLRILDRADKMFVANPALKSTTNCTLHYWWQGRFYGGFLTEAQVSILKGDSK